MPYTGCTVCVLSQRGKVELGDAIDEQGATFSEVLRRCRASVGLSQEALAARSGISVDAIGMLERGVRASPRSSTVVRLAEALRLRPPDREALIAAARPSAGSKEALRARRPEPRAEFPRELPRAPADFTGRADELATLRRQLLSALELRATGQADTTPSTAGRGPPVLISAIDGMGGVGKSALAIQAAHQLADAGAFPDGQLYMNLQGATPGLPPLPPLDALGRILRSLGLDPATIPIEIEEAAATFRSLAAGRRLLVLLDDARTAEQVRPLLPGSPTCAVMVTSRHMLATLEGAQPLHLDVLPDEQALELLGHIAGRERIAAEPQAAAEVVCCCARLPLAIRIAGARLAARPRWPVRELAGYLTVATHRLEALRAGELGVQACFDVSLDALQESSDPIDQAAAAAFALFSLPDGPDLGIAAAARLIGQPEATTRALVERLVDAQLLEALRPGRYQFHDLVRLYARQHAAQRYAADARVAALERVMGFYAATAWHTLALLRPGDRRMMTADPRWTGGGLEFRDAQAAVEWLEAELVNLLAAIKQAATEPAEDTCAVAAELPGQLTRALFGFFDVCGYWNDWAHANETALDIAHRTQDRAAQATALSDLGGAHVRLGRYVDAIACLQEAITLFRKLGDRRGQAAALINLGAALAGPHRYAEGVPHQQESLSIFRELGDRQGQARALTNLGFLQGRLGRNKEAIACLQESVLMYRELGSSLGEAQCLNNLGSAYERLGEDEMAIACQAESLKLFRQLGARLGQAHCLDSLGVINLRRGRHKEAIASLQEGLTIFRELGDRQGQAVVLRDLGDTFRSVGRYRQARAAWREGLAISEALQIPEAEEMRTRLASVPLGAAQPRDS